MLLCMASLVCRKSVNRKAFLIDFWVNREMSLRAPHEFDTPIAHHQWLQPPSHCPHSMPTCCMMMECYCMLSTFHWTSCFIDHSHYFHSSISVPSTGEWLLLSKFDMGDPFSMVAPFLLYMKIYYRPFMCDMELYWRYYMVPSHFRIFAIFTCRYSC